MLRPQDLMVAMVLALPDMENWTYASLAARLKLSASEAHAAVKRATLAGLLRGRQVDRHALMGFLEHGVRHAFYAVRGAPTRGVPTGVLAPPLSTIFSAQEGPVWPSGEGGKRGYALTPLYRTAPKAAQHDVQIHELLALVDALREGGARERESAIHEIQSRLGNSRRETDDG